MVNHAFQLVTKWSSIVLRRMSLRGQCYPLGHELFENCVTRVCEQNAQGGIGFVSKVIKCPNGDECVAPGTPFSATLDGEVYGNTVCEVLADGRVIFRYQQ
ncbi:hypothetical protein LOTGIDRAFT_239735 [Lottia gigantea]|uniref:Uncharacterized protein n=1 Tax=Lottia gigantea TaxID=225164 RepID=V4CDY0_LOTGI|nr:hypothetical protein LOTGIDRAFT_239735 [Lottia gigantea]ESP00155.1 hypothetical protein LOTGIDRAFT_239735 [Lottia gigantea]